MVEVALQSRSVGYRPLTFAFAAALLCAAAAQASTTLFNNTGTVCTVMDPCWQAGTFGVLVGLPSAVANMALVGNPNTDINIEGAVGVGSGSRITGGNNPSTSSQWDIIDFADPLTTATNGPRCPDAANRCQVSSPAAGANDIRQINLETNQTLQLATLVTEAISDTQAMSNYWAGVGAGSYSGTVTPKSFTSTTTNLGVAANGSADISVYTAGADLTAGKILAIRGDVHDLVILNFTGAYTASFTAGITLSGGITSDQVLINYRGTSTSNGLSFNGSTYNATVIVGGTGNYHVIGDTTINGRVLGGSGTLTWGNNNNDVTVNAPDDIDPAAIPEPSTWILMGTGVAGLIYFGKRRRTVQQL
jgi:PEP-CTERM motif